jgi:hypothetical protein
VVSSAKGTGPCCAWYCAASSITRSASAGLLGDRLLALLARWQTPRRGPRLEPAITDEILGDQRRAAHLAFVIAHQAAIGLIGKATWATRSPPAVQAPVTTVISTIRLKAGRT